MMLLWMLRHINMYFRWNDSACLEWFIELFRSDRVAALPNIFRRMLCTLSIRGFPNASRCVLAREDLRWAIY
jgi:hypothetical protein